MFKKHVKLSLIGLLLFIFSCSSGPDCLRATGETVVEEILVAPFNSLLVNEDIEVVLTQGNEYALLVETGKNLLHDFKAEVTEGQLELTMENTCQIVRGYNTTRVYVTVPDLVEIISATQYTIRSEGVLNFDQLSLNSVSLPEGDDRLVNGEFVLDLNVEELSIEANELADFEISGMAARVNVRLSAGHVRVFMPDLQVVQAEVFHRSSLDVTLNVSERVTGSLLSTGDLVLVNRPTFVQVDEKYKGRVIYR